MSIHGRGHSTKARISDYTFSLTSLDSLPVSGARASKVTGGQLKLRDSDVTLNGPWTLGMIHNTLPKMEGAISSCIQFTFCPFLHLSILSCIHQRR